MHGNRGGAQQDRLELQLEVTRGDGTDCCGIRSLGSQALYIIESRDCDDFFLDGVEDHQTDRAYYAEKSNDGGNFFLEHHDSSPLGLPVPNRYLIHQ